MIRPATPPMRRGGCPGVLTPMPTGDGLLVRLHPPGALTAAQARAVADAARACGNGFLDVTGRGNVQIRGVRAESHGALVERLAAADLVELSGERPIRLTLVSPLAGLDPADLIDARALAQEIDAEGRPADGLPVKTCVAVDGGGALPLDGVEADLRVVALGPRAAPLVAIGLGEGPRWIGTTTVPAAPLAIRAILARFAERLRTGQAQTRRLKNLPAHLGEDLARSASLGPILAPPRREMLALKAFCRIPLSFPSYLERKPKMVVKSTTFDCQSHEAKSQKGCENLHL